MTATAATTTVDSSKPENSSFSLNSVNITTAINMKTSTLTSERQSTIPLLRITSYSIINPAETTTPLVTVSETTVPISSPSLLSLSLSSSSSSEFSTLSPTFLPSSPSSSSSSKSPLLTHLFSSSSLLSTISPSSQQVFVPSSSSSSSLSPLVIWNNNTSSTTAASARMPPSLKNNNSSIFQQRLSSHQLPSLSATTSLTTNKTTIPSTRPTLAPSPRQVTTIPIQTNRTTATIITSNKRPTIIIYPTVSPESIVIPIVSCIFGFPLLALMIICCLRRRAKLARERDRRRNYDMQDHAVSLVRFSPIHRLNNRSSRAISLRPERSLSRGFPSLELDTVIEERSDPEQTQTDIISPESPLDPNKFRDFNSS